MDQVCATRLAELEAARNGGLVDGAAYDAEKAAIEKRFGSAGAQAGPQAGPVVK